MARFLAVLPSVLGTMQNLISHFLPEITVCLRVSASEMYQLFLHSSLGRTVTKHAFRFVRNALKSTIFPLQWVIHLYSDLNKSNCEDFA